MFRKIILNLYCIHTQPSYILYKAMFPPSIFPMTIAFSHFHFNCFLLFHYNRHMMESMRAKLRDWFVPWYVENASAISNEIVQFVDFILSDLFLL